MSQIRNRTKGKTNEPQKTKGLVKEYSSDVKEEAQHSKETSLETYVNYLLGGLVLAFAVYAYLQPQTVYNALNEFIGFSEHWDATPIKSAAVVSTLQADVEKQKAIVSAFQHGWLAYERDAMGADEYHPISRKGSDLSEAGGIGYTVIDSLDSMLIMGLDEEYQRARTWIERKLTFQRNGGYSTFETTIRVLGGLLSTYHLTGDSLMLAKAVDIAERILPAFDTPSGLPYPIINLAERKGSNTIDFPGLVSIAEVGTLQLEFRYLTKITDNPVYWEKVVKIMELVRETKLPHGMASIFLDIDSGQYVTSAVRLGSRADSFYEYLLKQYIQTNFTESIYKDMYTDAMTAIQTHLFQKTEAGGYTYTSELQPEQKESGEISWRLVPKQDHLTCFLAGSLMLGATTANANHSNNNNNNNNNNNSNNNNSNNKISRPPQPNQLTSQGLRDWQSGSELLKTCLHTHDTATGLSPEIVHFRIPSDGMNDIPNAPPDWYIKGARPGEIPPYNARYMLRPETIESLFIAYRLTGEQRYRDHGWNIFQAIEKHCRIETGGYATIINVDEVPTRKEDKMETFFLSETLKYLYLLFSDDTVLPLDRYVFNTEAHPFPIFTPPGVGA